ncbi:MAG: ATP-binding cassette domain-containing protein [Anaerolineaceae bacterium]|nr:ATP-binding cassette domain-containing protein [Anaerolineaceae bacterium]
MKKSFDGIRALKGIDFEVQRGEFFGFLGPNGAGKTTTINLLIGLARPDSGIIQISGINSTNHPKKIQHLIGVVPDESNLYPELSGYENLCFCASLYGMHKAERGKKARKLLEEFSLSEVGNRLFAVYSKGMKRRLTIAAGIIHDPQILFLDEPTSGIDVASARSIRRKLEALNEAGRTIFLTTHYIEEAERLCQRVAFIVEGRIVRVDTMENLLHPVRGKHMLQLSCLHPKNIDGDTFSEKHPGIAIRQLSGGRIRLESSEPIRISAVIPFFEDQGMEIMEARVLHPSLEEIFVDITGLDSALMRKEKNGKVK